MLTGLTADDNPDLLVGFDTHDDAGVYRIGDSLALVQTVDLITPPCDDPRMFGRIAAANALSDVYAMGGKPLTALNICCFPASGVPDGIYAAILEGAHDTVREAGATIVGGHTVRDAELKYGLAVTGTIDPERVLRNAGALHGDALVLTKPLGTGVLVNAARKDRITADQLLPVLEIMARLNDRASHRALEHGAHAATDVTGFGLAGHALEMLRSGHVSFRFTSPDIPVHPLSLEMTRAGVTTAMTESNREQAGSHVRFAENIEPAMRTMFFDPQTSGGLLVALPADRADRFVESLHGEGSPEARRIGEVLATSEPSIEVV